ncbi:MAG: DNA translocase FtsK 4TM domain-containing protein [Candidatus Saccharimonadales bacterium]
MAQKKKKTTRKKAPEPVASERSPFWAYTGAIFLMLLSVFLLLGCFGTGGVLPVNLYKGAYWTFGWAAVLTPVVLMYWGIYKFRAEDRRIPLANLISMLALLLFTSSWAHTAFATKSNPGNWAGGHGGQVGTGFGNVVLGALDKFPASLLLFIASVLAMFFAFSISPRVLLLLGRLFRRSED